jgi:hypothetical protein
VTRPLFEHDDLKEERLTHTMMETLAKMERRRVSLMEALARLAERQRALQIEMRTIEKRHRDIARDLPEHTVPEDRELTHEDVNSWCRSAYFNLAHTAPGPLLLLPQEGSGALDVRASRPLHHRQRISAAVRQ